MGPMTYKKQATRVFFALHAIGHRPAQGSFISAENLVLQRGPQRGQVCS